MKIELRPLARIKPYPSNPRVNEASIDHVAALLKEFKFRQPIVVDKKGVIVVGHVRYWAAEKLGLKKVPVHVAADLTPTQCRAYRIADNRAAELSDWDYSLLTIELTDLKAAGLDLALTAFDADALDQVLARAAAPSGETGKDPGEHAYREQYGVIVICKSAKHQQRVYEQLLAAGHNCRVVCT